MDAPRFSRDEVFFTDKQLRERWQCSHMKLWRLRAKGVLESAHQDRWTGCKPHASRARQAARINSNN